MKYIIDRTEDGIAVLECQTTNEIIELEKNALPKGSREGQVLIKQDDDFIIDKASTHKRKEEMQARLDKILGKK